MGSKRRWQTTACFLVAFCLLAFLLLDVRDLLKTLDRRVSAVTTVEPGPAAATVVSAALPPPLPPPPSLTDAERRAALEKANQLLESLASDPSQSRFEELHDTLTSLRNSNVEQTELAQLFSRFNQELKQEASEVSELTPLDIAVNMPQNPSSSSSSSISMGNHRPKTAATATGAADAAAAAVARSGIAFVGTLTSSPSGVEGWACPAGGSSIAGMKRSPFVQVIILIGGSSEQGGGHFAGVVNASAPITGQVLASVNQMTLAKYCGCTDSQQQCRHGFRMDWVDLAIPDQFAGHKESVFAVVAPELPSGAPDDSAGPPTVIGFQQILLPADPLADKKAMQAAAASELDERTHPVPWDSFDGSFETPVLPDGVVALSGAGGAAQLAGSPWLFSGRAGIWRPPIDGADIMVDGSAGDEPVDPALIHRRRRRSVQGKGHGNSNNNKWKAANALNDGDQNNKNIAAADAEAERNQEMLAVIARKHRDNTVRPHDGRQLAVLQGEGAMAIFIKPISVGVPHRLVCYFSKKPGDSDGHVHIEIKSRPNFKTLMDDTALIDFSDWRMYEGAYFSPHTDDGIQLVISAQTESSILVDSCSFQRGPDADAGAGDGVGDQETGNGAVENDGKHSTKNNKQHKGKKN